MPLTHKMRIDLLKRKIRASEKSALISAGTLMELVPKLKDDPIKWLPAGNPKGMSSR